MDKFEVKVVAKHCTHNAPAMCILLRPQLWR